MPVMPMLLLPEGLIKDSSGLHDDLMTGGAHGLRLCGRGAAVCTKKCIILGDFELLHFFWASLRAESSH